MRVVLPLGMRVHACACVCVCVPEPRPPGEREGVRARGVANLVRVTLAAQNSKHCDLHHKTPER